MSGGPSILHLAEVDSTNAEAMRRAAAGETGPIWIMADRQTAGRGRSGRAWASTAGNLHASLLVSLDGVAAQKAYQLSLVAGVAMLEAVRALMQPAPGNLCLKWPNDLMIGPEKAGGILVESSTSRGAVTAVIGLGINIVSHPDDLGRPATHLGVHGSIPSTAALVEALGPTLLRWLALWDAGNGFPIVREAWLSGAHPIGEQLKVSAGASSVEGTFQGLDPDGALLLRDTAGTLRTFTYGDVTLAPTN